MKRHSSNNVHDNERIQYDMNARFQGGSNKKWDMRFPGVVIPR